MNSRRIITYIVIMVCLYVVTNIIYYGRYALDEGMSKEYNLLVADHIYDEIVSELEKPIMVSKIIAGDEYLKEFGDNESKYSKTEAIKQMQTFLMGINDSVGFDNTFFVSDSTLRYYTDRGSNKVINPSNESNDIWYSAFVEGDEDVDVQINNDDTNDDQLTLFIDVKVYDDVGRFIGVCGTGISIKNLQKVLARYESEYNLSVNVADSDGVVQINSDDGNVKTSKCNNSLFKKTDDFVYHKRDNGAYTVTKYIEDADWYYVVEKKPTSAITENFKPDFLVYSLIGVLIIIFVGLMIFGKGTSNYTYERSNDDKYDALTGVPNRNYFKAMYGERGQLNTTIYKSLVMFDIDYFKEANDTKDGDQILKDIVALAKESFGDKGEIFRWGGDEFVVLLEWSVEFGYEMCKYFLRKVETEAGVTVSIGITEIRLEDNVKKNYHRAVHACYLVKEMGGNGIKSI